MFTVIIRGKHMTLHELLKKIYGLAVYKIFSYAETVTKLYYWSFSKCFRKSIYLNRLHAEPEHTLFYTPHFKYFERSLYAQKKEPMTRRWIDSMKPGEVLWDIGANIGVFSLLAATKGLMVVAFEPLYSNYYILCKNIEINSDAEHIIPLPIALASKSGVDLLYIPCSDPGCSGVAFGNPINEKGEGLSFSSKLSTLGLTGNIIQSYLPQNFANPNHIKIDVDGIELEILRGIDIILADDALKSILVEIDFDRVDGSAVKIENLLRENGFINTSEFREATVKSADPNGPFNYIFIKE